MENEIAKLVINNYQMEDLINILLENNYTIKIKKYSDDKILFVIFDKYKTNGIRIEDIKIGG